MADKIPTAMALEGPEPQERHWPLPAHPTPTKDRKIYSGVGSELFHGTKEKND